MNFEHVYFFNGTAYAGKSTIVKRLAEKYKGIACEENYHNSLLPSLDSAEYPALTYARDLKDWHDFIRRSPDEYAAWIAETEKECEKLELRILQNLVQANRLVFVDTNIRVETLKQIAVPEHVIIMLADPMISVNRFFDRPDREKKFLYRLMLDEPNPDAALENFRQCLARVNSRENYEAFLHSGFQVIQRDEARSIEETLALVEKAIGLR